MLYDQVKQEYTIARKQRSKDTGVLSVLLGAIEKIGKDKRNGLPTDDEVSSEIKKMVKNLNMMVQYGSTNASDEIHVLQGFLPKQLTLDELRTIAKSISGGTVSMADMMKHLKANYPNQYESKMVAEAIK